GRGTMGGAQEGGWHGGEVRARGPITLDPAAAVLHYGQEIFEGLKAYNRSDGSIALFRPEQNARRFQASAARMTMPDLPEAVFLQAGEALGKIDSAWIPKGDGRLFMAPFMFRTGPFLRGNPCPELQFLPIPPALG